MAAAAVAEVEALPEPSSPRCDSHLVELCHTGIHALLSNLGAKHNSDGKPWREVSVKLTENPK